MSLSRSQSLRVAAVLEDCSDQLDILGYALAVLITHGQETAMQEQETARVTKLKTDCQGISRQVSKLRLELKEKQTLSSLQEMEEDMEQKKKAENMKREAKKEQDQRRETLQRREEIQQKTKQVQDMAVITHNLEDELTTQAVQVIMKKNAHENILQQVEQTEKNLESQQELLHKQLEDEKIIHKDFDKFLQSKHKELLQLLQQLEQHTQQILEEKKQNLNSVSCKLTVIRDQLMQMREKFREMEQVVIEDREEQEELYQLEAKKRAAVKVQIWWRGCMLRLGLGHFKKDEEGKKGKKKKEGKKKK
ncbi:uncharacterized protein V6R79_024359 [Siganus canaliculatus]